MNSLRHIAMAFALVLLAGFALQAQDGKLKKANELYDGYSFPEAAEAYKKILSKEDLPEAKIKLAECYRLMNMPVEAEYWYEQVVQLAEAEPIHRYHYGMMLKSNNKFEEAKQAFIEYAQLVPTDTRGIRQVEACDQFNYFMTDPGIYNITLTNINSAQADFGPAFYKEGIVYASETGVRFNVEYNWRERPFLDLFYAQLENQENPAEFKKGENFKGQVNTWVHEGTVTFTEDGQTMYFCRNNFEKGKLGYDKVGGDVGYNVKDAMKTVKLQIFESKLKGEKWEEVKGLPFNSDQYSVGHPALSPDGQALYFISDMPGGYGMTDVYVAYKNGDSWGTPENLGPEINTEGREMFPFISADGALYFSSDALPGLGGLDIFSTKLQPDGTWSAAENLRYPVNTNSDDFAFIINKENERGYFSSNRPGGAGDDDIYTFTRLSNIMTGIVVDCETGDLINGALVKLMEGEKIMQKAKTQANGMFTFPLQPGKSYTVVATKAGYDEGKEEIKVDTKGRQIELKIPICPEGAGKNCIIVGKVFDKETKEPVDKATVKLVNSKTNDELTFVTGADGTYTFNVESETDYTVYAQKDKYFTVTKTVSTIGKKCSAKDPITVEDIEITKMPPVVPDPNSPDGTKQTPDGTKYIPIDGSSLPPIIDNGQYNPILGDALNHIYYDFDKHYIRKDARPELDKVVKFMYDNPALVVELRAHTDSRGSHEYNQALSDRRAASARSYITKRGISNDRLNSQGYGETQLTNECADGVNCNNAKHQDNRRTEFVLLGVVPGLQGNMSVPRYYYETDKHRGKNYYKNGNGSYSGGETGYNESNSSSSSYTSSSTSSPSGNITYSSGSTYYDNSSMNTGSTYSSGSSYSSEATTGNYTGNTGTTSSGNLFYQGSTGSGKTLDCCYTPATGGYSSGPATSGIEYKIQLDVQSSPNMGNYSTLSDLGTLIAEPGANGMQRVMLSGYKSQADVEAALMQVHSREFKDAFIATYQNGMRVGQ